MKRTKLLIISGLAVIGLILGCTCGSLGTVLAALRESDPVFTSGFTHLIGSAVSESAAPAISPDGTPAPSPSPNIVPTTIGGSYAVKNSTSYDIDFDSILNNGCALRLTTDSPQILIIHTHSSEAYTPAGLDRYEASGDSRTLDAEHNIIRVGDELTKVFESCGLNVIHDTGVYDYPSYTGSYNRSGEKIEEYLARFPTIKIIIDLHRDALGSNDVLYKTVATEDGVCASQVMILIGTDAAGLTHPNWRQNLSLAVYLQNAVSQKYPSLMRPISLVSYRYNQQLTEGSMIIEVGSNGNTLQEALAAVRLFGNAAGEALAALVE